MVFIKIWLILLVIGFLANLLAQFICEKDPAQQNNIIVSIMLDWLYTQLFLTIIGMITYVSIGFILSL